MIDLNDLKRIALENAEKRQKNGANVTTDTRKMLKHCATEVLEFDDPPKIAGCQTNNEIFKEISGIDAEAEIAKES